MKRASMKPRTQPLRRKRKTQRRVYTDRADYAWAQLIKHRAGWRCESCGTTAQLQAHHIRPRTYMRLRFHLSNGVCLCWREHKQFAHGDAPGFTKWLRKHVPQRYSYVMRPEAVAPIKRSDADVLVIAQKLEAELAKYPARLEEAA